MKRYGLGMLLALAFAGASHAGDGTEGDADVAILDMSPPRYPSNEARQGIMGTVVLVVTVSESGEVADIAVEKSSRNRNLDIAAIEAARNWRFSPAREGGRPTLGMVRVPVDFSIGNDDERYRAFLADLNPEDWVPAVPVDAQGTVPGYVPDPKPLGFGSVEETLAMLAERGERIPLNGAPPGLSYFTMKEGPEYSQWEVYEKGFAHAPALKRKRLVSDGRHGFFATRTLCDSTAKRACTGFQSHTEGAPRQKAIPLVAPGEAAEDEVPVGDENNTPAR